MFWGCVDCIPFFVGEFMYITDSIRSLKGVGEKVEEKLNKLGIYSIEDLLEYYPRTYQVFNDPVELSEVEPGKRLAVKGCLHKSLSRIPGGRVEKTLGQLVDGRYKLQLLWYRMPYLRKQIVTGKNYIFYGSVKEKNGQWIMEQPEIFDSESYKRLQHEIQPVYSLTEGVNQKLLGKLTQQLLNENVLFEEYLPEDLRMDLNLAEYNYALHHIHYPKDWDTLKLARRRLGFDEFFLFALAIRRFKASRDRSKNIHQVFSTRWAEAFIQMLPYSLTKGQILAWQEICEDFVGEKCMNRLLQGDVGSGKTVISQLALLTMVEAGYQGCLMAPTEVLAKQHYDNFVKDFEQFKKKTGYTIRCGLLTGSMKVKEKRSVYEALSNHEIDVLIGTHAVIQDQVQFKNLGMVITDEQHRFGVNQREWLLDKGVMPHVLVMSATPIPRTLAIILYGDLDISVIRQMPKDRLPIKNCVVDTGYRKNAYNFIKKEVSNGRQAYVICPMVEESEMIEAENVLDYTNNIKSRHYCHLSYHLSENLR